MIEAAGRMVLPGLWDMHAHHGIPAAELGFVQIKIYEQLPGNLVPFIIERAAHHGHRLSGHITHSMSAREAVEAGYDELQHIAGIMGGMLGSWDGLNEHWQDNWNGWAEALADLQPGSEPVREFVDLLVTHGVTIDPTLAMTETDRVSIPFEVIL